MGLLRTLLERISRGRIIKRRIEVSGGQVALFVSPDAQLKYLKPGATAFDQDLIEIAECFVEDGDVVWDIGANVGVFTYAALARVGKGTVVSVEADSWLSEILAKTSRLPEHIGQDVRVINVAVSDRSGIAEFLIAQRGRASNALTQAGGRSQMGGVREKKLVPTLTIDLLRENLPSPTLLKIDVEGAEAMVLAGASKTLSAHKPIIYAEIGADHTDQINAQLTSLGYEIFNSHGNPLHGPLTPNLFYLPRDNKRAYDAMERLRQLRA